MRGDWRPSASRAVLESRAGLLRDIRAFFAERRVLEVETPVLSASGNTDPAIEGLRTDSIPPAYLRTSPEYPMKRLLAAGMTDIYELGRVFRAGEKGRWHNPEFTLLEWYRVGRHYLELADEVVELVKYCAAGKLDDWPLQRFSYRQLFQEFVGLDPFLADETEWAAKVAERGIRTNPMSQLQYQDLLLTHVIQPAMDPCSLSLVYDFPPEQAALACIRDEDPPLAERFELFLGQAELANGYHELGDAGEQQLRFERDNRLRKHKGDDTPRIDKRLIAALEHGLPDCSGVALGVDRLLMCLVDLGDIASVLAFPDDRA